MSAYERLMEEVGEREGFDDDFRLGMDLGFLRALLAERTWRPIETAPKVYSPPLSHYNHHAPQILGLWGQAFYCVCSWGGPSHPYWIGEDNKRIPFQPTHWMPLPPPPEPV